MTTRTHRCGDGFRAALATHIGHQAELANQLGPESTHNNKRHGSLLAGLAGFTRAIDLGDHRIVALWLVNQNLGGDRMAYRPGPAQAQFFAQHGLDNEGPEGPNEAFTELMAAAVEDLIAHHALQRADDLQEVERARKRVTALDALQARAVEAEAGRAAAEAQLAGLRQELATVSEERAFLVAARRPDPKPRKVVRKTEAAVAGGKD